MAITELDELRAKLAALEACVNGAASILNENHHSRLNLIGEGLMGTFYDFVKELEQIKLPAPEAA